jgi:hypothetical protein
MKFKFLWMMLIFCGTSFGEYHWPRSKMIIASIEAKYFVDDVEEFDFQIFEIHQGFSGLSFQPFNSKSSYYKTYSFSLPIDIKRETINKCEGGTMKLNFSDKLIELSVTKDDGLLLKYVYKKTSYKRSILFSKLGFDELLKFNIIENSEMFDFNHSPIYDDIVEKFLKNGGKVVKY